MYYNVTGIYIQVNQIIESFYEHELNFKRFVKNSLKYIKNIQCKIFPQTLNVLYLFRMCGKEKV